jgi:hypothetical protein
MANARDPEVGKDILRKYLQGGVWKRLQIAKKDKGKSTASKRSRIYIAIPPKTGWPGGRPEDNGWKPGSKK